jgi:hypothetical protein
MNELPRPNNWQTAASIILDSVFDLASTSAVANCPDVNGCFDAVIREFDYLVDDVFNQDGHEMDGVEELINDIAAYAFHAYSLTAEISKPMAVNEIFDTLVSKQRMYGQGNIARFGLPGILIRLNDKIERLKNLQQHEGPVIFEPIKDTWLDIVGYSVIAIMWINDWFLLELKKDSISKNITKETK